ncbi:MAG TPA: sugar phosphate nucleotidyltransferase [Thermoanaerobaculia bacterium]
MIGFILAAGYGTRLRPVTYTLPKPMVPLCNRPLIAWAVESFLDGGVRELVVNLHHLPEPLERYVRERYGDAATLHFSYEAEILGTGGAIRRVGPLLEREEAFFLVNGDTVQFPPYAKLEEARRAQQALAALALRHPPQGDRFTSVWLDNGRITGFGQGHGEALMFSGAHAISTRVLRHLPDKEFSGIVDEVYQPLLADRSETIAGVIDDGLWFDVGTPQRYLVASRALLEATVRGDLRPVQTSRVVGDSLVDVTAKTPGTLVRSTVGARSIVKGELRDTTVWDDCTIGGSVLLERCIVAHGVELSGPLELHDALVCRDDAAIPNDVAYERRDGLVIAHVTSRA